jgi:hypothetical protein
MYREVRAVQDRGVIGGDLAALEAQGFHLGGMNQGEYSRKCPLLFREILLNFLGLGMNQGLGGHHHAAHHGPGHMPGDHHHPAHHNPLDRNHDGRVDLKDLNTRDRNHDGIPDNLERGNMNQGLAGDNLLSNRGLTTANPLDRNNDGKVNLQDLNGRNTTTTANQPVNLL